MTAAPEARDLIILGATARAACASAIRAGYHPWCADLFADVDLAAMAPAERCPDGTYPAGLAELLRQADLPASVPVLLTGAMENHLTVVRDILAHHPLLGPDLKAMAAWRTLPSTPARQPVIEGLQWPLGVIPRSFGQRVSLRLQSFLRPGRWLNKPQSSGGGIGVRLLRPWSRLDESRLIQRYIRGQSLGVLFRASQGRSQLLGVTRQLIGDTAFCPQGGFRYTGSLGPVPLTPDQNHTLQQLGQWLVDHADLDDDRPTLWQGVFGVDLILDNQGRLWPIEINPRYTASVEVLEAALQFAALNPQSQPRTTSADAQRCAGKAYIFARNDCGVPDLSQLFPQGQIADIPRAGTALAQGQPICSLLTQGPDIAACHEQLRHMARRLYTRLCE
jgi:predicted ATP-grasp superfamily ATP-dependent carboligase